jgi:hypothetical protein
LVVAKDANGKKKKEKSSGQANYNAGGPQMGCRGPGGQEMGGFLRGGFISQRRKTIRTDVGVTNLSTEGKDPIGSKHFGLNA